MDPDAIREKRKLLLEQWCTQQEPAPVLPAAPPAVPPPEVVEVAEDDAAPPCRPKEKKEKSKAEVREEPPVVATPPPIPVELECIVQDIATTGKIHYPWRNMRILLAAKLEQCCHTSWKENPEKYYETIEEFEEQVLKPMSRSLTDERRSGPPFTAQRMCELLVNRTKTYKSTRKYCAALEKMMVVSSRDPSAMEQSRKRKAPDCPDGPPEDIKRDNGVEAEE